MREFRFSESKSINYANVYEYISVVNILINVVSGERTDTGDALTKKIINALHIV